MQAQLEAQRATQDFQRATEVLRAAKETISLAEQRLLEDDKRQFDSAWQEMLNHATQRVRVSAGCTCAGARVWACVAPACGQAGWACGGEGGGLAPHLGFLCPRGFPEQSKQACCSPTSGHLPGVSAGLELSHPPRWQPPNASRSGPVLVS